MKRPYVVGGRVYLRPIERADIDCGWLDWINDQTGTEGLFGSYPVSREELERYYEESQPPIAVMFAICVRENDRYIGNARLSEIEWINRLCTYGRLLGDPEYRGRGYGSEALILLLRYGFHTLGMNRIWSVAWAENEVSLRSNDKVGMTREGIMREKTYKGGRFYDGVVLAMLREDFDRLHGDPEEWKARLNESNPMPRSAPKE